VQHTVPHLVEQILCEPPTSLDQRFDLDRLGVTHERWHNPKATARFPGSPPRLRLRPDAHRAPRHFTGRLRGTPVGVSEVRELSGTVARERLPRGAGMLVTLSHFTGQARAEAAQLELELIDNRDLCARLERAGATDLVRRTELLQASHPCPQRATPMLLDHSPHGWWLHCPRYRDGCKGKQHLSPDPARALELLRTSRFTGGTQNDTTRHTHRERVRERSSSG
jgi:hypothetical protein